MSRKGAAVNVNIRSETRELDGSKYPFRSNAARVGLSSPMALSGWSRLH